VTAGLGRNQREDGDGPSRTDEAALLGTALAAILALTLGEGGWGWLGLAIGVSLLIVLITFFGFPGPGAKGRWGELTAFSAVASLCFVLVVAWPWQTIWANLNPSEKAVCAAVAEANEAKWIGDKDVTDGLPRALT
jgi:hypothetical protein